VTSHATARFILSDARFSIHPLRFPVGDAGFLDALESGSESMGT